MQTLHQLWKRITASPENITKYEDRRNATLFAKLFITFMVPLSISGFILTFFILPPELAPLRFTLIIYNFGTFALMLCALLLLRTKYYRFAPLWVIGLASIGLFFAALFFPFGWRAILYFCTAMILFGSFFYDWRFVAGAGFTAVSVVTILASMNEPDIPLSSAVTQGALVMFVSLLIILNNLHRDSVDHDLQIVQTANKQALEAFRRTSTRLIALLENFQAGVLVEDEQHHIALVNQTFCDIFQIADRPSALIGKPASQIVEHIKQNFALPSQYLARTTQIAENQRPVSGEVLVLVDGRRLERDFSPIWLDNTNAGKLWLYRDVTQRFQNEQAIRASEAQLRALITSMADPVYSIDLEGRFLFYQPPAAQMDDTPTLTPHRYVGKGIETVFPPALVTVMTQAIERVRALYSMQQIEYSLTISDKERHFSARVSPLTDSKIRLIGVTVVARDVTAEILAKRREARLRELESLYQVTTTMLLQFTNLEQSIYEVLHLMGSYFKLSRVALFQLREDEHLIRSCYEWCAAGVESRLESWRTWPFEQLVPSLLPLLMKDGVIDCRTAETAPEGIQTLLHDFGMAALLMLPFYVESRLDGFIAFAENEDAREWLPEDISTLRSVTESVSRALEKHRSQLALVQARDAALRSAKLKSEFMSNMSHEVRTPMTGVLGMLELLQETTLDEEQHEYAEGAYNSATHLLQILDDILDFSKIESGRMALAAVPVDVRSVVMEVVITLGPSATKKNLPLTYMIDEAIPEQVWADPTRLRQILFNLTSNAIKFTERGSVHLKVQQQASAAGRARLRFDVIDTGIGIAPEDQARIFESFVQVDGTSTRRYGGTGLGLAICRQLVQMMGGQLELQSKLGEGSTFYFSLFVPIVAEVDESTPQAQLKSLRLLVVDDDPTTRYALSQQLRAWGIQVYELMSPNGLARMLVDSLTRAQPIHAVLYHYALEQSEQFVREVREQTKAQPPLLICLGTAASSTGGKEPVSSLFDVHLSYPVHSPELRDLLSSLAMSQSDEKMPQDNAHNLTQAIAKNTRLLLADDNVSNQIIVIRMLQREGFIVDAAQNGEEALEMITQHQYALVLMDIHMPKMDGIEATRRIRALPEPTSKVPIIALTASVLEDERQHYLEVGMNDIIGKPFTIKQLRAILALWVPEAFIPPHNA